MTASRLRLEDGDHDLDLSPTARIPRYRFARRTGHSLMTRGTIEYGDAVALVDWMAMRESQRRPEQVSRETPFPMHHEQQTNWKYWIAADLPMICFGLAVLSLLFMIAFSVLGLLVYTIPAMFGVVAFGMTGAALLHARRSQQ